MEVFDALNTALQREKEGRDFYREAASKSSNQKAKRMFEWLASEEDGHIKLLQQSVQELQENQQWLTQDTWGSSGHLTEPVDISEFPSKPDKMGDISPDSPELEILEKAIEAERSDILYYEGLAEGISDPNGKIMIEKLAHVEKGHASLLEEEYQWIKHSKDLFTLHRFLPAG